MCLIVLAYKVHPRYPLLLAANRDEFHERPAVPAHYWSDAQDVLAGRDLRAGGTWLGLHRNGRFAALTNYRDLHRPQKQGPSRGLLVRQALDGEPGLGGTAAYEGFNLLHGPLHALRYHNNIEPTDHAMPTGIHGISNALLNTPWPKVQAAKVGMEQLLRAPDAQLVDKLFALLATAEEAPPERLPNTGLSLDMERAVSPIFIRTEGYGTRCSTVLLLDAKGTIHFEERSWPAGGRVLEQLQI